MWWLLKQAWPVPLLHPRYSWVTATLCVIVMLLALTNQASVQQKTVVIAGLLSASLLLSLTMLAVGTIWRAKIVMGEPRCTRSRIGIVLLNASACVYLALLPLAIWLVPQCWPLAAATSVLGAWFGWWSIFVAGMSVTGDWI
jgi:hypothetical protein